MIYYSQIDNLKLSCKEAKYLCFCKTLKPNEYIQFGRNVTLNLNRPVGSFTELTLIWYK